MRTAATVGYEIDQVIERLCPVDDIEMFEFFNMGICYVVDPASAERTLSILKQHGRIATAVADA
jgi:phosphoribosylaminoimidazole (AIR) synthetase